MTLRFGPFELDEAGRVVMCARQEVPLQPRVFDLLVYLVHNHDRVVSKDELLEAVWPRVTVTDNSLQRAVSALRAVLRKGGMESAIRNVPGKGYRFCIGDECGQARKAETAVDEKANVRTRARRAAAAQAWVDAETLFAKADVTGQLEGADLHQWALALQCTGRTDAAIPILVRAVAAHTKAGDVPLAVTD